MAWPQVLLKWLAPLLVLLWAGWQATQEYRLRQVPALVALPAPVPAPGAFDGTGIATLFGLAPAPAAGSASHAVRAIVAERSGQGRALISSNGHEGFYRVGDRLPSGAVLRRVEPGRVVLWHGRREQVLGLASAPSWLAARAPGLPAQRHLRPGPPP
ncbi:type II secretion system protein N [Pseudomonas sp. TE3610]